ncbi:hypothetical protein TRFO_20556 [Tritrichomonas foetus]|uniref:Uncharacterized protein n=1 Tax=Tritrichomonas foetus TaxID=1144522 RepID=A0A1J4KGV5_9EUKA|nr:hypothetical protein TRFO_20556 [Tritrichomonas foetus]|eukprot:OHT10184.1 hypothetical protein TRFO_20556 [Tritrichomonas foetus]
MASLEKFLSVCGRRIEAPLLVKKKFAPEIEDDSQYSKKKTLIKNVEERLKSRKKKSDSMELFLSQLSEKKKNNWKLYNECREFEKKTNDLYKIIKNDDIKKKQTLTYTFGFDMNQKKKDSIFERVLFLKDEKKTVHIASFYGSIKIKKKLLLNGADLSLRDIKKNNVMHFAVAGGNFQIIRILEQEQWNLHGTPKVATRFHRFEIFEWLKKKKYNENNEEINVL